MMPKKAAFNGRRQLVSRQLVSRQLVPGPWLAAAAPGVKKARCRRAMVYKITGLKIKYSNQ